MLTLESSQGSGIASHSTTISKRGWASQTPDLTGNSGALHEELAGFFLKKKLFIFNWRRAD